MSEETLKLWLRPSTKNLSPLDPDPAFKLLLVGFKQAILGLPAAVAQLDRVSDFGSEG